MATPTKRKAKSGVNYLEHFPKDFLCPYGVATKEGCGSDDDVYKVLLFVTAVLLNV